MRFVAGLPSFFRELRGFPRRVRYTVATRGSAAMLCDIACEFWKRVRQGSLAAPEINGPDAMRGAELPAAVRGNPVSRDPLHLVPDDHPTASIVIPVFNKFMLSYMCLASVIERTKQPRFEVIVVDDGSADETRELEKKVSGVRVVRHDKNRGYVSACNNGGADARGEFIVFLNNDTLVTPGWLQALLEPFESEDVGLVGARLINPGGRLQEAGAIVFSDGSAWNYGRGDDPEKLKYKKLCDVHYCSGACLAIRRELFQQLGGFDEQFAPMYYEDTDLAFSVRTAGFRVVYQPACVIVHAEGGTSGVDRGKGARRFEVVNQHKFVRKWSKELARHPHPKCNPDIVRNWPAARR